MRLKLMGFLLAGLSALPVLAQQPAAAPALPAFTLEQAAKAFGARPDIDQMSLSPDGKFAAAVMPAGGRGTVVGVMDLSVTPIKAVPVLAAGGDPERIGWCRWSGARRLLCSLYGVLRLDNGSLSYVSRLIAVNADGTRQQMLRTPQSNGMALGYALSGGSVIDWNTGKDGHVLMARDYVPEFSTGTRMVQSKEGLGVDDVNSLDLQVARVESPRLAALDYISDGQGQVRIMAMDPERSNEGYASGKTRYLYRARDKKDWQTLSETNDAGTGTGFRPHYVDPVLDVAYGLKPQNGRQAAFSVSLDGKATEQLILARPDVDIDGFITIGRNRRVIGVDYETDRPEVLYTDPALKRLASALSKAVPDLPLIRFVDSAQDESQLLLWAGSDVDPGRYYIFDKASRKLDEIAFGRSALLGRQMGAMKSVQVKAADGTLIPAYLTLPPGADGKKLPAIVMPHGGPGSRDSWGFDWLVQFWANRGYAVLQPNFRGSTGYGDAWFQNNGFQSWRTAIGDVTDSGRWLIEQGIADPAKLAIVGWSYGGYAALQSAVTQPDLFKAVIAIAPVTDLGRLKEEWSGWSNYYLQKDFIGSGAHVEEGSPARQAAKIKAPVLLFHGSYDRNVGVGQSQLMDSRLRAAGKQGRLVTYDKLDHYLDDGAVREDMLTQSAKFLEQSFAAGGK